MIKKLKSLAFACLTLIVATTMAQNINLRFTGKLNNGRYIRLDSVEVYNRDSAWMETLVYPDTILVLNNSTQGLQNAENSKLGIETFPNPFNGNSKTRITVPESGYVTLQMHNLTGQKIAEHTQFLNAGEHLFVISLNNAQVGLLTVTTDKSRSTIKLLNKSNGNKNAIIYTGLDNKKKQEKMTSTNGFQPGNTLRFIGYATQYGEERISTPITQQQRSNEDIQLLFTSLNYSLPTVSYRTIEEYNNTSARIWCYAERDGRSAIIARGVCWSTNVNPTITDSHTTDGVGTGLFRSNPTNLTPRTNYYFRPYATNAVGTAYGQNIRITTKDIPSINTLAASAVTSTFIVCGGYVRDDGNDTVTARGVCWDTIHNPTINSNHTTARRGTGQFTSLILGLTSNTTYYVRAYAINTIGIAYGQEYTITTDTVCKASFSVDSFRRVLFSPGNLQWSATNGGSTPTTHNVFGGDTAAGTWRFALNQWDYVGDATTHGTVFGVGGTAGTRCDNAQISSTYKGWIDLFGWGTSGYDNKYPYLSSRRFDSYYLGNTISNSNYDWGVYNDIYNPQTASIDSANTWRTLTYEEWDYLLNKRQTTSGIRCAPAEIQNIPWPSDTTQIYYIKGLILLPDNWMSSIYTLNDTNSTYVGSSSLNILTVSQWSILEKAGSVFLTPASYWSSRKHCSMRMVSPSLNNLGCGDYDFDRKYVRLVKDAQ